MKERSSTDRIVGGTLRFFRLQANMTQTDLGQHMGVTFQQIQKYEGGTNRLPILNLLIAGRVLGFTPAEFFEMANHELPEIAKRTNLTDKTAVRTRDYLFSEECFRFARAASAIPSQAKRRNLIALAETMIES